jgi:hypothetical protein
MRTLRSLVLLFALVPFVACKHEATEQSRQAPSPAPQASVTPETKSPHANQVSVSLGKTSSEAAPLNPRIAEAYSLATVRLARTAAGPPVGFPGAPEPQDESPPPGMKWLVVIVETGTAQGEVTIPLNKIRLIDQSKKTYRLVSFGGSDAGTFTDFREYDKYKMVEPPKLIMKSPIAGKQNLLFAVAAKAEGLSLEF